ncbi:MAG: TraR/DksA C4-type zinc finger protein [Puniceicoccales bacterium]|nr:TraR/DksA C4-type zinc finger protein [Puniceicoccales bacterium]
MSSLSSHLKKALQHDGISSIMKRHQHPHKCQHHRDLLVFSMEDVRLAIAESQHLHSECDETVSPKEKVSPQSPAHRKQRPKIIAAAGLADLLGFDPRQVSDSMRQIDREVPKELKRYYDRLTALKARIQGHTSQFNDDEFDIDFALTLIPNETEALSEIEKAIDRIFDGTFGVCEITGQPIDEKRLLAIPFTRYSLDGQAKQEHQKTYRSSVPERIFPEGIEESSVVYDEEMELQG